MMNEDNINLKINIENFEMIRHNLKNLFPKEEK